MTDIDQLLDDLQHGRHVSLIDLPAMLNELRDHKQLLATQSARLAAAESEMRRLRQVIEDCEPCWGVFDASDSLVSVDLHSEIALPNDGTYVRCLHLVPLSVLEETC